jgi:hypothetical protein
MVMPAILARADRMLLPDVDGWVGLKEYAIRIRGTADLWDQARGWITQPSASIFTGIDETSQMHGPWTPTEALRHYVEASADSIRAGFADWLRGFLVDVGQEDAGRVYRWVDDQMKDMPDQGGLLASLTEDELPPVSERDSFFSGFTFLEAIWMAPEANRLFVLTASDG